VPANVQKLPFQRAKLDYKFFETEQEKVHHFTKQLFSLNPTLRKMQFAKPKQNTEAARVVRKIK
jgi:hypothetical protein